MKGLRRLLALAATVAPLGCGAIVARALATRHPHALAIDFAQPLVVATNWGSYGAVAFAILATSVAISSGLLALVVARTRADARAGDVFAIVVAAVIGIACAAAWPFVFSSDAYAYAAYGDMAARGIDPYRIAPAGMHDPILDAARWQWGGNFPVDVYGPAMLALARALVTLAGDGAVASSLSAMRVAAALAFLASIPLAHVTLRALPPSRRFVATCAYALNPVVLWSVAEGHNDAFVLLGVALAGAALACGASVLGAVALGLSPVLKAPGLFLAAGFALDAFARRHLAASRHAIVATLAALAVATAIALPPLLPAIRHVGSHGRYAPSVSLQGLVGVVPALALALAAGGYGVVRVLRCDRRGHAWLGIAIVCALPNAYPWYALWLVPWAIAAGEGKAAIALWLATIFAVTRYLPDASQTPALGVARILAAVAVAPLALALLDVWPRNARKKVLIRS